MPRKSRRQLTVEIAPVEILPEIREASKTVAAGYVRISGDSRETDSVETQKLMIAQFVEEHPEFELADFYVDDGFSGTTFERPAFHRLMDDIRHGLIQCIIVKDLSRFGRNYIETGYYIETLLPQLNIRLLSINDRFDSSREEDVTGIRLPIKNMINSLYARDLSKKRSHTHDIQFQTGTYKYREGTYGYILDRKNNVLVEDPLTSGIIKIIFRLFLKGKSASEIARLLNLADAEIPTAAKYRLEKKVDRCNSNEWTATAVRRILLLPTYTGDTVYGRTRRRMGEQIQTRHAPKEYQTTVPNTHVPLVSHRDFMRAEEIINSRTNKGLSKELEESRVLLNNLFGGKVRCRECGRIMQYQRRGHNNSRQEGYAYAEYSCIRNSRKGCGNDINEDLLKVVVMDQIRAFIKTAFDYKKMASDLLEGVRKSGQIISVEKKIDYAKRKINEMESTLERLYTDFSEKTIGEDDYKTFQTHYLREKEEYLSRLQENMNLKKEQRHKIERFLSLEQHLEPYLNTKEYVRELIDELVEEIRVGKDSSIEITLSCEDVFREYLGVLEGEEN